MQKYPGDDLSPRTLNLYQRIFNQAFESSHVVVCGTFRSLSWIIEGCHIKIPFRSCIVWHKPDWTAGAITNMKTFAPRHELLLHFSHDSSGFFADAVRVPYGERALAGVAKKTGRTKAWMPNPLGARRGDVWTITSERLSRKINGRTQANTHPCQKPTELLRICLLSMTKAGDAVHEPFRGSDNLERLCKEMERVYVTWPDAEEYAREPR
jgi:hypothetical protein